VFNKILVPLDSSKLAEKALPYAEEMAIHFDSNITLLHSRDTAENTRHKEMQTYLDKTAADLEKRIAGAFTNKAKPKAKVTTVITGTSRQGTSAAVEILNYTEKEDIDMIIMATHGRTGITRWVLGDTANKVARASTCPILLIRAATAVPKDIHFERILVPLDGSKESEAVLPYVENLVGKIKPDIKLLNVVELLYHIIAYPAAAAYGGDGIVRVPFNPEEMKPHKEASEKYLKGISGALKEKGYKNSAEVRIGVPGEEIIEAEKEIKPELIIMSAYGHSGFGRWEHGSITDKVLHAGTTPLLLIRPPKTRSVKPEK
jgi:nucleotide-binding universal stress UspA family protein